MCAGSDGFPAQSLYACSRMGLYRRREGTTEVLASAPVWYARHGRRLGFFLCMLVLLAACSGKKVPELEGLASYYAEPYHGRRTANGEVFNTYQAMTAAHRTLPFNTIVRVENKV